MEWLRDLVRARYAGARSFSRAPARHIGSLEHDRAGITVHIPRNQIEKGGLTRTVWSNDANGLSASNTKVNSIRDTQRPERFGETLDLHMQHERPTDLVGQLLEIGADGNFPSRLV